MIKLAIVTTHPIQYYAPLFKLLTERGRIEVKVFYTWEQAQRSQYDPGFGKTVAWDIPLLEGYAYAFVKNTARQPGSHHFRGIINSTLPREVENWGADALLVFGWSYHSHLRAMRYFKGRIPVFFRGDSTLLDEQPYTKRLLRKVMLTWVYRHVDTALYVGQNNRAYYLEYGLKPSQLAFVPHAVDNQRFQQSETETGQVASAWRASLGIDEDETVFLFVGKLEPKKNPVLLLEAFKRLGPARAHLLFVGNGVLEPELKRSGTANVHFIDFQNQARMPTAYRLGDVFVLPSKGPGETWGLAVNEAMACGLPILVSDKVGCTVDLVTDGRNGYVFRSENVDQLSEKMRLLLSRTERTDQGRASRQLIEYWSLEVASERLEKAMVDSNG
ncbi:MAG: glycosyltransferase family 4 protein [Ferruginibacter sp.]|nr:glycosyltransferase family 4 protein [Cytophagales bacterium]